jgi:anti-sigma B factor antagonist
VGDEADQLAVAIGDDGVVVAAGEVDTFTAPILATALLDACATGSDVVLDLTGVSFMDSAGLNVLVRTYKALGPDQVLKVRGVQPSVRQAIELGGLSELVGLEG